MIEELVAQLYDALAHGDRNALLCLLADDFSAEFADGLPAPVGGVHRGTDAIDNGWWELGRRYRVRANPTEWIPTVDGRLLVVGRYRGTARATGAEIDAGFAHLWSVTSDGLRLMTLQQFTDTARWRGASEDQIPA